MFDLTKFIVFFNTKIGRILTHLIFWIVFFLVIIIIGSLQTRQAFWSVAAQNMMFVPVIIAPTYITLYYFIPRFLFKRRYVMFALLNLLAVVFFVFFDRVITYYAYIPKYFPEYAKEKGFFDFSYIGAIFSLYFIVALATTIKFVKYWFIHQQQKAQLEKQNLVSELALLRSQINPHFLFNTLNNIEGLISNDAQKASDSIIRLSSILRYMLYESNAEKVPLAREVEYLKNFIELSSLRIFNPSFFSFNISGKYNGVTIAPMLLVPLVENAIKHGDKNVQPPGITINLDISPGKLDFEVINYSSEEEKNKDNTGGIGLKNLQRRLELLYPEKFDFFSGLDCNIYRSRIVLHFV
jgi:sensor histidine kinase YesM